MMALITSRDCPGCSSSSRSNPKSFLSGVPSGLPATAVTKARTTQSAASSPELVAATVCSSPGTGGNLALALPMMEAV
jgi:hypothetical protein